LGDRTQGSDGGIKKKKLEREGSTRRGGKQPGITRRPGLIGGEKYRKEVNGKNLAPLQRMEGLGRLGGGEAECKEISGETVTTACDNVAGNWMWKERPWKDEGDCSNRGLADAKRREDRCLGVGEKDKGGAKREADWNRGIVVGVEPRETGGQGTLWKRE